MAGGKAPEQTQHDEAVGVGVFAPLRRRQHLCWAKYPHHVIMRNQIRRALHDA